MKNLKFKYISAENFLCYEKIELDLESLGSVVLVKGTNLDVRDQDGNPGSNGSGKSSLQEILVYGLYGKTIKRKLSYDNIVNRKVGKGLRVEVRWDNYRVVRSDKGLQFWDNGVDMSQGIKATQAKIENAIGLSYQTFVNIAVFRDSNANSFLDCDLPTKREIVENLLSLDKCREYFELSKKARSAFKDTIKLITRDYERILFELDSCKKRVATVESQKMAWKQAKKNEMSALMKSIESKQKELIADDGTALSAYEKAREEIERLQKEQEQASGKESQLVALVDDARTKLKNQEESLQEIQFSIKEKNLLLADHRKKIDENRKRISSLQSKKGTVCGECYGTVQEENYQNVVVRCQNVIDGFQDRISQESLECDRLKEKERERHAVCEKIRDGLQQANLKLKELSSKIASGRSEITKLSRIEKPEISQSQKVILDQIESLKSQLLQKKEEYEGPGPYEVILKSAIEETVVKQEELDVKSTELKTAEEQLPYYEFWVTAFGDNGIRKFIIDGIIPALNAKIQEWLEYLIAGTLELKFDNQLNETIQTNPPLGDPFVYNGMSGGEQRRLNLALSQAFAHIMMLNSGCTPSVVFLDEVSTNVDQIGVQAVYDTIILLSEEKQVFVTTHDRDLLEMLSGFDVLHLQKEGGLTTLKNGVDNS